MFTYEEIEKMCREELEINRILETHFLGAVLSGNPEHYNEGILKIVSIGHEIGGKAAGRALDENGHIPFHPKELERLSKDYLSISIQSMSTAYSLLIQSRIKDIEKHCKQCVCLLFDVGYTIGMSPPPEDDTQKIDRQIQHTEELEEFSFDIDDSDLDFLRRLL